MKLHAIYVVLGDSEFLGPSVRSVYQHVDGITVVTTYDRDWQGAPRPPDPSVDAVLSRQFDPDRKVDLLVIHETNEARARNRAMDVIDGRRVSSLVHRQHERDTRRAPPDYFLIVDADEVWDGESLTKLREWTARHRAPLIRAGAVRYFQRWTYRVEGLEWLTVLVRRDCRLNYLRNRRMSFLRRASARFLGPTGRRLFLGVIDAPATIATFHHGSYVGPRDRIVTKLSSFGHAHELQPAWLERVYDEWTPASRDFHPVTPSSFPSAAVVPVHALPRVIRDHSWPPGYLE